MTLVALRIPGSSTTVDDDFVGNTYSDTSDPTREIKILDYARDDSGLALVLVNGYDEVSYEAEVTAHSKGDNIGRHYTVKRSTLESKYLIVER